MVRSLVGKALTRLFERSGVQLIVKTSVDVLRTIAENKRATPTQSAHS